MPYWFVHKNEFTVHHEELGSPEWGSKTVPQSLHVQNHEGWHIALLRKHGNSQRNTKTIHPVNENILLI